MRYVLAMLAGLLWASQGVAAGIEYSNIHNLDRVDGNIMVRMRDGVRLSTYVFYPKTAAPHPVILIRTPYYLGDAAGGWWADEMSRFLAEGYVVILQNERAKTGTGGPKPGHIWTPPRDQVLWFDG